MSRSRGILLRRSGRLGLKRLEGREEGFEGERVIPLRVILCLFSCFFGFFFYRKCRWRSSAPSGRRYRRTWRRPYGESWTCRPPWRKWSPATKATRRGNRAGLRWSNLCPFTAQCVKLTFSPLCPSLQRSNCCGVLDSKERPVRTLGMCLRELAVCVRACKCDQ